jgi:glutathione-specific gamma-glutamylcyclotransferase
MPPRPLHLTPDHVARATRPVEKPVQPREGWRELTADEIAAEAARLMDARPPGLLKVFAYGSLLWKPVVQPVARSPARAPGWHRSFCILIEGFRATPEAPGLMMALAPGGTCTGFVLDIAEADALPALTALVGREMPYDRLLGNARFIHIVGPEGPSRALTFYANPRDRRLRGLSPQDAAHRIARACGYAGSCAEYLRETVTHLEENGIRDRNMWRLQRLVAAEVDRLFPG